MTNTTPIKSKNSILILDDDIEIHNLIKHEFKNSFYRPEIFKTVTEATEALSTNIYFAAILDINLGGETSGPVFVKIKNDIKFINYNIPIFIMSSLSDNETIEKINKKTNGFIKKPFKKGSIAELLSSHIESHLIHKYKKITSDILRTSKEKAPSAEKFDLLRSLIDTLANVQIEFDNIQETTVHQQHIKLSNLNTTASGHTEEFEDYTLVRGNFEENEKNIIIHGNKEIIDDNNIKVKHIETIDLESNQYQTKFFDHIKSLDKNFAKDSMSTLEKFCDTDIDKRNEYGQTHLMLACLLGLTQNVNQLITKNASVKLMSMDGKSCLHYACFSGNDDLVLQLIDLGMSINLKDSDTNTPLTIAIRLGRLHLVEKLMERKPNLQINYKSGEQAFHIAAQSGNSEVFRKILSETKDPLITDYKGRDLLWYANQSKSSDIKKMTREIFNKK